MRIRNFLLISVLGLGIGNAAIAQNVQPAELPPAGFGGRMFVDSTGCVFIRAGTPQRVSWVPRVTRNFDQICGFVPTFAPGETVPVAATTQVSISTKARSVAPIQGTSVSIPKGYKAAWSDGRLNAQRGPRSEAGTIAMNNVWTDSVPMKRK